MEADARVEEVDSIAGFFEKLEGDWSRVRVVKVADQGLVEPARRGVCSSCSRWSGLSPRCIDLREKRILRWQRKWDVGSNTTRPGLGGVPGPSSDPTGRVTREKIVQACRKRSVTPVLGEEWKVEDLEDELRSVG